MFNEINMELLGSPSWLRVIDNQCYFVIGGNHSFLGYKTIHPDQAEFLMNKQRTDKTVLKSSALYTDPDGFLSNGKFRPRGKAIAEELTSELNWRGMFQATLDIQQQYLNRPGCFTSIETVAQNGGSHPIYINTNKSDTRRFIETAAPTPDFILYEWETNNREGTTKRIALMAGSDIRVAQNINANLILSDIPDYVSYEDVINKGIHSVLPKAVGEIEGTPALSNTLVMQSHSCDGSMLKKVQDLIPNLPRLHGDPIIACWVSQDLAFEILINSRKIYGSRESLVNIFQNLGAYDGDLNVELKQLNIQNFWPENCPIEAHALDSLRYRGFSDTDINEFLQHNCQRAWHTQIDKITESFEAQNLREHEFNAELEYLKHLVQLSQDPEVEDRVQQIFNRIGIIEGL